MEALLKKYIALLLLLAPCAIIAQPDTDIILFNIDWDNKRLNNARNVTDWEGYDNQPFFSPEGDRMYFTRMLPGQTEAFYYDAPLNEVKKFTNTKESEYSPTVTPDGQFISVIQVESDSAQRLWKFPLDGGAPQLVFENIKPVGYQAWLSGTEVAMFVLGSPNSLQIGNITTGESKTVTSSIGRSLHYNQGTLFFVHKESADSWWLKKLDPKTGEIQRVAETLAGREDLTVTSSGRILMGDGQFIYELQNGKWKRMFDLKGKYADLNRLAVSPDERHLALVVLMD